MKKTTRSAIAAAAISVPVPSGRPTGPVGPDPISSE